MNRPVLPVILTIALLLGQSVPVLSATIDGQKSQNSLTEAKSKPVAAQKKKSNVPSKKTTKTTSKTKAKKKTAVTNKKSVRTQGGTGRVSVSADAAVLIDAVSGQVLFDKQAHKRRPPASTTKIMTTLLAMEYGDMNKIVTVSNKAGNVGQATIHLDPGEKLTLGSLVEGALIKSGNDACVAIAETIAGDEQTFVQMMNTKAKILGAYDTNFENTNGLPNSKHYSSAYDLALMARYALKFPMFAEITRKKEAQIQSIEPQNTLPIRNTNKLLWMYEFADGVKTGTTTAAGKCLVASATKNGRQLIAVVLNAPGRFQDAQKLLEYGFNSYQPVKLAEAGDEAAKFLVYEADVPEIPVVYANPIEFLALPGESEQVEKKIIWTKPQIPPIAPGEQVGEAQFWLKGKLVAQSPLYATKAAKPKGFFKRLISNAE